MDDPTYSREEVESAIHPAVHDWISDNLLELASYRYGEDAFCVSDIEYMDRFRISFTVEDIYEPIGDLTISLDDIFNPKSLIDKWAEENRLVEERRKATLARIESSNEIQERAELARLKGKYE